MVHYHTRNNQPDMLTIAVNSRPASSLSRIVFPWMRELNKYNTMEFNPVSTEGRMSMMDVERILNQIY